MDQYANNDDDDFLSDGLDDLSANLLQHLEHKAILSTQHHASSVAPRGQQTHGQNTVRNLQARSQQSFNRNDSALTASIEAPNGSAYEFDDEDVINLDEPSTIYDAALRPHVHLNNGTRHTSDTGAPSNTGANTQSYQLAHRPNNKSRNQYLSKGHEDSAKTAERSNGDTRTNNDPDDLQKRINEVANTLSKLHRLANASKS